MRVGALMIVISAAAGLLGGMLFAKPARRPAASAAAGDEAKLALVGAQNDALRERLESEKKWRALAERQLLGLRQPSEPTSPSALPQRPVPLEAAAQPAEDSPDPPRVGRRNNLEARIDEQTPDPVWQSEVVQGLQRVFESFPRAEVVSARCGGELCRVEFKGEDGVERVEALMNGISNMSEVQGERMIEIDDNVSPPVGIAYFSRHGAISLLSPAIADAR